MLKTFALPAPPRFPYHDGSTGYRVRPTALFRVWIETGNTRQPLAGIWIDRELRFVGKDEEREKETEPAPPPSRRGCPVAVA